MKRIIIITIFIASCTICFAQNYNIQQNQQNVNINVPVIEKTVYVDRYRTVYVEKPRTDRKLSGPVLLLGYLCVFPEDIGDYQSHPTEIIKAVNRQNLYGRNTWRIPTQDELMLMEANADQLGMGDHIYMATSHANGHLRLVSTEANIGMSDGYAVGNLLWSTKNYGAKNKIDMGIEIDAHEYSEDMMCPNGWRLPTKQELQTLIYHMDVFCLSDDGGRTDWYITDKTSINNLDISSHDYNKYRNSIEFALPFDYNIGITVSATYLVKNGAIKVRSGPGRTPNPFCSWAIFKDTSNGRSSIGYVQTYDISHLHWHQSIEEMNYREGYVRCVRDL